MCYSPCGGLPIGVLMTESEKEEAITEALRLHSTLLDADAFGGRGNEGPVACMTD